MFGSVLFCLFALGKSYDTMEAIAGRLPFGMAANMRDPKNQLDKGKGLAV